MRNPLPRLALAVRLRRPALATVAAPPAPATTVARNTATTWLLGETAAALADLKTEALRHDQLLTATASALPDGTGPPPGREAP